MCEVRCEYCSGVIGNDDEFAVLSGSYDDGVDYAKKLSGLNIFLKYSFLIIIIYLKFS